MPLWQELTLIVLFACLYAYLSVTHPRGGDVAGELGLDAFFLLGGSFAFAMDRRRSRAGVRTALWLSALGFTALALLGILVFHFLLPWYVSPTAIWIIAFLAMAIIGRPLAERGV